MRGSKSVVVIATAGLVAGGVALATPSFAATGPDTQSQTQSSDGASCSSYASTSGPNGGSATVTATATGSDGQTITCHSAV